MTKPPIGAMFRLSSGATSKCHVQARAEAGVGAFSEDALHTLIPTTKDSTSSHWVLVLDLVASASRTDQGVTCNEIADSRAISPSPSPSSPEPREATAESVADAAQVAKKVADENELKNALRDERNPIKTSHPSCNNLATLSDFAFHYSLIVPRTSSFIVQLRSSYLKCSFLIILHTYLIKFLVNKIW